MEKSTLKYCLVPLLGVGLFATMVMSENKRQRVVPTTTSTILFHSDRNGDEKYSDDELVGLNYRIQVVYERTSNAEKGPLNELEQKILQQIVEDALQEKRLLFQYVQEQKEK